MSTDMLMTFHLWTQFKKE